jgi:hypothetical protein
VRLSYLSVLPAGPPWTQRGHRSTLGRESQVLAFLKVGCLTNIHLFRIPGIRRLPPLRAEGTQRQAQSQRRWLPSGRGGGDAGLLRSPGIGADGATKNLLKAGRRGARAAYSTRASAASSAARSTPR